MSERKPCVGADLQSPPAPCWAGTVMVWALSALLRFLSPIYFSGMPEFGISPIGIASGCAIGVVTVLLTVKSPAKKAAKVSPLTAVSGKASPRTQVKKAANNRICRLETALGMDSRQMGRMITTEAAAYGLCGIFIGCCAILPLNRFCFEELISLRWGTKWQLPAMPLCIIVGVTLCSLALAVCSPSRRLRELSVVDTISGR